MNNKTYTNNNSDSDSDDEKRIKVVQNNIYFYCPVTVKNILQLNVELESVQQKIFQKDLFDTTLDFINVYIHSDGGDLFAGLSGMSYINSMITHVNTVIDGFVASAATLIALGGHTIYMQQYATILIHQLSTGFYGKFEEFKDEYNNNTQTNNKIKSIYKDKTNIPEKQLNQYFMKDIYLTAETCKLYNIVHHVF